MTKREGVVHGEVSYWSVKARRLKTFWGDDFRGQIMHGIAATSFLVPIQGE